MRRIRQYLSAVLLGMALIAPIGSRAGSIFRRSGVTMMTTPGNTGAAVITIAIARTTTIGMTGKMPGTGDGRRADISSIETSTGSIAGISPNTGDGGIVIPTDDDRDRDHR